MKTETKKEFVFVVLLTLFAFFFFYVGEKLINLSELNIYWMFIFWLVVFYISKKIIDNFQKIVWQR